MNLPISEEYFFTEGEDHVAIFVQFSHFQLDGETIRKGTMYHVFDNNTPQDTAKKLIRLTFEYRHDVEVNNLVKVHKRRAPMGTILSSDLDKLRLVCEQVGDVLAPETTTFPNCSTWVNNVIYELNANRIISFRSNYPLPDRKKQLIVLEQLGNGLHSRRGMEPETQAQTQSQAEPASGQ